MTKELGDIKAANLDLINQHFSTFNTPRPESAIIDADAYKHGHPFMFDPDAIEFSYYMENRADKGGELAVQPFFGLQHLLLSDFLDPISGEEFDEAAELVAGLGVPFAADALATTLAKHDGYFAVEISAVPEGTLLGKGMPHLQVKSLDPDAKFLAGFVETKLDRLWYPQTEAATSYAARKAVDRLLEISCDEPASVNMTRLNDFGSRAASCPQQAGIGGMAHLLSFMGTDNIIGLAYAKKYYGGVNVGASLGAAEHSTVLSWGQGKEIDFYNHFVETFKDPKMSPFGLAACVSDTTSYRRTVTEVWCGSLKDKVEKSGLMVVIRPDSGDPLTQVMWTLSEIERLCGFKLNRKGYKVLNLYRCIQGDGLNLKVLIEIAEAVVAAGYSLENVAFGMGSGLIQDVRRDDLALSFKLSALLRNGQTVHEDVFKNPEDAPWKKSKGGIQAIVNEWDDTRVGNEHRLINVRADQLNGRTNLIQPVWNTGRLLRVQTFSDVQRNMGLAA